MAEAVTQGAPIALHERSVRQKRRILEAASRLFRHRGLHATGMRDIADELGMHVGNLYYYFRNKQDLLAFCQDDALRGLLDEAATALAADLPPDRKLRRLIVAHVERLNEATPGSLAHLEVEALEEPRRSEILARRQQYEAAFRTLIEEGMAAGLFRAADAKVASLAILGALNWTVKWFRSDGRRTAGSIGREFGDLLVGGLLAQPDPAGTAAGDES